MWKKDREWGRISESRDTSEVDIAVLYMSDNGSLNCGGSTKDRSKWVLEYILEIELLRLDDG